MKKSNFRNFGQSIDNPYGELIYMEKPGNKILAVSHLDTVIDDRSWFIDNGRKVFSPMIDNRLGTYILLDLLPEMGIRNYDILLTDREEEGLSTSQFFSSTKKYNWIFSFDRRGTDVVMYQYENILSEERLNSCGFSLGVGSFSDISFMDFMGVVGFNFGNGCSQEHSYKCNVVVSELLLQIKRFSNFYKRYSSVSMPHVHSYTQKRNPYRYTSVSKWMLNPTCSVCGFEKTDVVDNICGECFGNMF